MATALLILHGASERVLKRGGAVDVASGADPVTSSSAFAPDEDVLREELAALRSREEVSRQLGEMPFVFTRNDGQWPEEVKYGARGHGLAAAFTERGMTLSARLPSDADGTHKVRAVSFDFFSGEEAPNAPEGERKLPGVHHYLLGNDPAQWHTNVPLYEAVRYDEVAPGVALLVSDREGALAYDLHVEPGAKLDEVAIACSGIDSVEIEPDGTLVLATPDGAVRQSPPRSWYELDGGAQKPADVRFRKIGESSFGFEIENPDVSSRLIVDPTVGLTWSTFLGSDDDDVVYGVDFLSGKVTVVGATELVGTASTPFPVTSGVFQSSKAGGWDAFVTRLDPAQSGSSQLTWSTLIGGSGDDQALSLDLTSGGKVAVCGKTASSNFPTTAGGHTTSIPTSSVDNAFALLLNNTGTALDYGTYYGSTSGTSRANSIKINSSLEITVVGYVEGSGLPMASGYDTDYEGNGDAFVAQFDTTTSGSGSLTYGTYVGDGYGGFAASDYDEAFGVALEGSLVYVVGATESGASGAGFHTDAKGSASVIYDATHNSNGVNDCFVLRLNPSLSGSAQVRYATFVGGEAEDVALGVVVDDGVVHFCGYSEGSGFPTSGTEATAFDSSHNGALDAILVKLDPDQTTSAAQLLYSTFIGGSSDDIAYSIAQVQDRSDLIVGMTESSGYPTAASGGSSVYDNGLSGTRDAFLSRLTWKNNRAPANQLEYSTFIGGDDDDEARGVVLDGSIEAYFGGWTASSGFPTSGSPFDSSFNGGTGTGDAFACWFTLPPVTSP
ncbi:MAG: hypothetical protein JNL90_17160 [Planctomycetes bacterium]|nr:hypothetical protein [Planctomycetota bacterium]